MITDSKITIEVSVELCLISLIKLDGALESNQLARYFIALNSVIRETQEQQ